MRPSSTLPGNSRPIRYRSRMPGRRSEPVYGAPVPATRRLWQSLAILPFAVVAGCSSTVPNAYVENCDPALYPKRSCITALPAPARDIAVGEHVGARVDAKCEWNRTGVLVKSDAAYRIVVTDR